MNILICDEKKEFVNEWKGRILKFIPNDQYIKIQSCTSVEEAEEMVNDIPFDIAFMDTEVNGESTLELVKDLRAQNHHCAIIFVSNHYEHISQSFEIRAFQFLFKDIDDEILESELERATQLYIKHKARCVLHTMEGIETFLPDEIYYIETRNRKTKMMTKRGEFYGEVENMKKLKNNLLEFGYFQIHQSYFLNLNSILSVRKGEVQLVNDEIIPTSILNRKEVKEKLEDFLKRP
ncbi:MAG: response regulator transcription factor [Coprobacillus sp.]|nr:response regulator transcription factor [Coprobacillus sp.]